MGRTSKVVVVAVSLVAAVAFARSAITTEAGCHSEFGRGAASKSCVACVKSKGKFVQHAAKKGVWVCE